MNNAENYNDTIKKFGYPASLIKEYNHWVVLLRPKQATLGALVLACREDATSFSQISTEAFEEQQRVVQDIEAGLKRFQNFDKINYLMLMMVDKEVHYHVLPRYASPREFENETFEDPGWPAVPDLAAGSLLEGQKLGNLVKAIQAAWPSE